MILHPIPYKEGIIWVDNQKSVNKGLRWWVSGEDGLGRIVDTLSYLYYGNPVLAQSPNLSLPDIPYIEINTATDRNYTQEDIIDAWEIGAKEGMPFTKAKKESLFNILNPKPVSVEIDMYNGNTGDFCEYWKDGKTFLKVKKVNYE